MAKKQTTNVSKDLFTDLASCIGIQEKTDASDIVESSIRKINEFKRRFITLKAAQIALKAAQITLKADHYHLQNRSNRLRIIYTSGLRRMTKMEAEIRTLEKTIRSLTAITRSLEASNEMLTASNEQLTARNEKLEACGKELGTILKIEGDINPKRLLGKAS